MHYRTYGTPRKDAQGIVRNAVLIMHGTGGTGGQFTGRWLRRRAVRAGAAARRVEVLHHPARRHRPRRLEQAEQRPARQVPALRLRRHGRSGAPARDRGAGRQPPAPGDGHVDGRHAHLDVGLTLSRLHGRADAARERADADQLPQPRLAARRDRRDPQRSRMEERRLHLAAAEPADGGADAVAGRQQPGDPPSARRRRSRRPIACSINTSRTT